MRRSPWSRVDFMLLAIAAVSVITLPVARALWIGPALWDALAPFEFSAASIPYLARVGASGLSIWAGTILALVLAVAGSLIRSKASTLAGRLVLAATALASVGAAALDVSAIHAARAADPVDFGVAGVERCHCPEDVIIADDGTACGCDGEDRLVVVVLDRDHDDQLDSRCLCSPPASMGEPCAMRCEPTRADELAGDDRAGP